MLTTANGLFECVAWMESDDATCRYHGYFAGHRIPAGTFDLVMRLETAETGEFYVFTAGQTGADLREKSVDHLFGFSLVQADTVHDSLSKFGFCECHGDLRREKE